MKVALLVAAGSVGLVSASGCSGDACHAEDTSMLQVARSAWDWSSCTLWLDQVVKCMKPSTFRVGKELGNVTEFDDDDNDGFKGFYIDDGQDDMFDDSNYISVRAEGYGWTNLLNYTQQCDGQWRSTGVADVEYFTCRVDAKGTGTPEYNASTLWFAGFRSHKGLINGLNIYGELGSDGDGWTKGGSAGCTKKGVCGTYSQTLQTGDPSINRLLMIPGGSDWQDSFLIPKSAVWTEDGFPTEEEETEFEHENTISEPRDPKGFKAGGKPVHAAVTVLWGGGVDDTTMAYTQAQFNEALNIIASKC